MLDFLPLPELPVELSTHLVTNAVVCKLFDDHRVENHFEGTYRYVNVFNPEQPLREVSPGRWRVADGAESRPVVGINIAGSELCAALLGARLPRLEEWVAAAGEDEYPWGDEPPTPERANYGELVGSPSPVGHYDATGAGWYDLAGNVAEWCVTGTDVEKAEQLVVGGGWNKPESHLRNTHVRTKWRRVGTMSIGFRCARAPDKG